MSKVFKFAKIIEVDGEQVLFYIEPNNDQDPPCETLHQIVRIDGVCADIKMDGMTYAQADKAFNGIGEEAALVVLNCVRGLLAER